MSNFSDAMSAMQSEHNKQLTIGKGILRDMPNFVEIDSWIENYYLCISLLVKGAVTESRFERFRDEAISKIKSLISEV